MRARRPGARNRPGRWRARSWRWPPTWAPRRRTSRTAGSGWTRSPRASANATRARRRRLDRRHERRGVRPARLRTRDRQPGRPLLPPAVGGRAAPRKLPGAGRAVSGRWPSDWASGSTASWCRGTSSSARASRRTATSSCSGAANRCPTPGTGRSTVPGPRAAVRPISGRSTPSEVAGVHWFNAGNHLRAAHDLAGATVAYDRAAAALPAFAEAEASLGAVRQLEGALDQAEAAYRQAARARPDLPGLDHNLALLKQERVTRDTERTPSP